MPTEETIYVLGAGAIGLPLAAFLARAGKRVLAVRTSVHDVPLGQMPVHVDCGDHTVASTIDTISLARLPHLDGMIVVAAKLYANEAIAQALRAKGASGPVVIMQNGIGVEQPLLDALASETYRCVIYATSEATSNRAFAFRPVTASPVGCIRGTEAGLARCIRALSTDEFPLRTEGDIRREVWKKAIINTVFNSLCPLLGTDNGVFVRDDAVTGLARQLVSDCLAVTGRLGMDLDATEVMSQIAAISRRSDGQLISTLQDIRHGRQTEMQYLNLEIARVASTMQPPLPIPRIELLGTLVVAKSLLAMRAKH